MLAALWQPVTDSVDAAYSLPRLLSQEKYSRCPAPATTAEPDSYADLDLLQVILKQSTWVFVLWGCEDMEPGWWNAKSGHNWRCTINNERWTPLRQGCEYFDLSC